MFFVFNHNFNIKNQLIMKKALSTITLNSGNKIPILGFGTYQIRGQPCYQSVLQALKTGYTHIDSASVYKNQQPISKALKASQLKRQDIYITSKIGPQQMGYENAKTACENILKSLDTKYLDLLLIHWPASGGINPSDKNQPQIRVETWKALIDLQKENKVKDIGVSNFLVHHLQSIIKQTGVVPAVNQFELHPFLWNQKLISYCRQNNITIEAYSPLARNHPQLISHELIVKLSKKYQKTPHQILIRWSIQNGFISLPKSQTKERIVENFQVFDFELGEEEMREMGKLNRNLHTCWDPESVTY